MGIYIKDYKIPNGECEHSILDFENMTAFAAFGDRKHYKLVEVTEPHGRLIDADALFKTSGVTIEITGKENAVAVTQALDSVYQDIEDAPTVIEAEGE